MLLNPKQKRMSSETGPEDVISVVFLGASKFAARLFDNDLQIILILTGYAEKKKTVALCLSRDL
jgi:hypothetical protein